MHSYIASYIGSYIASSYTALKMYIIGSYIAIIIFKLLSK